MNNVKVANFVAFKTITKGSKVIFSLIVIILVLVYLNVIFIPSLLDGLVHSVNDKVINTTAGNLIIESSSGVVKDVNEVFESVEKIEGVEGVASHYVVGAEIKEGNRRSTWGITAIDPVRENKVFTTSSYMASGRFLEPNDTDKIVLGMQVAGNDRENLELYSDSLQHAKVGDTVQVSYNNGVSRDYEIIGIYFTEDIQTDTRAFVTRDELNAIFPGSIKQATSIHVRTRTDDKKDAVAKKLDGLTETYHVKTWHETAGIVKNMTDSFTAIKWIVRIIAFIVGGVAIFIVTYIDLINRKRQIGIERAIGISESAIIGSYLLRALVYSSCSSILAALLYLFCVVPIETKYPFHFPFGAVFLSVKYDELLLYGFVLILVALAAAYIPAKYVTKMKIIDAIWGS